LEVQSELRTSQSMLEGRSTRSGNTGPRQLQVIAMTPTAAVLGVRSTDASVTAALLGAAQNGRTYQIVVSQSAHALPGFHFGNIVISTSSTLSPEVRVPFRGIIQAQ